MFLLPSLLVLYPDHANATESFEYTSFLICCSFCFFLCSAIVMAVAWFAGEFDSVEHARTDHAKDMFEFILFQG